MFYLLFFFYLLCILALITNSAFVRRSELGATTIRLLFLLQVITGCFAGWLVQRHAPFANDYWNLNEWGKVDHALLMRDPGEFFLNIFHSPYAERGGFFSSTGSYWNDLRDNILIKIIALLNFITGGNYYINVLFFNIAGFMGHIALYRVFKNIFRDKKWLVIIGCFLLPSTLFFTTGLHKDCIIFTALGLFCFGSYFLAERGWRIKYFLLSLFSFMVLLLIRNYCAAAIVPCLAGWIILKRYRFSPIVVFTCIFIFLAGAVFLLDKWKPSSSPVHILVEKQQDFLNLDVASSQFTNDTLQPNLLSLVRATPRALNHSLMRPYVWEFSATFLLPFALEIVAFEFLLILLLLFPFKPTRVTNPFCWFGIMLVLLLLLFIGYITPNAGALIRYRSIYLPLLITPLLCAINWRKIKQLIHINK